MAAGAIVRAGHPLLAEDLAVLDVAAAGSIGSLLSGHIKTAIAGALKLDLHSHALGADAVAKSLVDGSLRADVFIPITPGPMLTVMRAGMAEIAQPIARTEMVITYSPKSRFAARFDRAAKGDGNWWEILQEPGLKFARSNPAGDPGGRNIIFTMMLAAKKYSQPDLVQKVLGATLNPEQIGGGNNQARLQSGELDASPSYKVGPGPAHLPYVPLSKDINLSETDVHGKHPEVNLVIAGKTFVPEPLVFYAALLKNAANPKGGAAFLEWLKGAEAQGLLRANQFDPAGDVGPLRL